MAAYTRADANTESLFVTYIQPQAIPTLENDLLMYRLGEPQPIPSNAGDTVQVQYAGNLSSTTTPVDELVGGFANSITHTTATLRVRFFANDVQLSRLVDVINQVNWRRSAFGRLVFNAAEVADLLFREAVAASGATAQIVNDRANVNTLVATDTLNVSEINEGTTALRVANVDPHRLCNGKYALVIHNQCAGDMRADTGGGTNPNALTWYDMARRLGDGAALENARVGATMGAEIFETSAVQSLTNTGSVTYYNNFYCGDSFIMCGSIGDLPGAPDSINSARPLIKLIPPEYSQATPHGNRWILGWDFYGACGRIDATRGRILQAAS